MKRILQFGFISLLLIMWASQVSQAQIISQYIETESGTTPKGIEIWNNTGATLDFAANNLVIEKGTNGGAPSPDYTLSTGTLTSGDVLVIGTSDMEATTVANGSVFYSYTFTFNGDDALVIKYGGVTTDVFGDPGTGDPGTGWAGNGVQTYNQNIEILPGITAGDLDGWTDPSERFQTVNTTPSLANGDEGFGTAPSLGGNIPPSVSNVVQTPMSVGSSDIVTVSADITDSDGTIITVELHWGTTSGSLTNTISMSNSGGDTYTTNSDILAQPDGTTVYYEIAATDDEPETTTTSEFSYTVFDPSTTSLPYNQPFDADLGDCYTYSVSGDTKFWIYDSFGGNGFASMNGYNSGETEEDWLILPGIDFDSYSGEYMSFDTWYNFGNDDLNNYLKLLYSSDYPGVGDPSGYTWTELSFTQGNAAEWTHSGYIDVSGITGNSVYIAFKYHYEPGSYRFWEIDNLQVFESVPVDVTFQVNMEEQVVSGDGVHVAGSFNNWDPAATLMTDPDLDDIYTVTLTLNSNWEYQFKYLNGNAWGTEENVPAECQAPGTTNRYEVVGSPDYSIPVVCFSSCVDCGTLSDYDITFRVDMKNETVTGEVYLAGDFNGWSDQAMTNTTDDVYELTVTLTEGSYHEYKFKNGPGGWESFNGSCVVFDGGNRFMVTPAENTALDLVCFNSCEACPVADFVLINELDSDQSGTDADEFIELYDGGVGNTDLSGLVVVLYNGSNNLSYGAFDLDGFSTDANGYFVMGSATVPNVDMVIGTTNILQNGADAAALYVGNDADFPNDTPVTTANLLDALVYDTDDSDDPELLALLNPGQPQVNERGRGDGEGHSNQRIPNGSGGQLNTYTYDQSPPTPGAENMSLYTDWTGAIDSNWDDAGNWTNGVPTGTMNATIPDVSAKAPFPVINSAATCLSLYIATGASLDINPAGSLTVIGSFTNAGGSFAIKSDASGTGSLITSSTVSGTVERYFTGNDVDWHLVSSPVAGAQAGVFLGMYLQSFDPATYVYTDIEDEFAPLNVMEGYALYSTLGAANTVSFDGSINAGSQSANIVTGADSWNWNLLGNPYPSSIDWEAVTIPANMSNEVHYIVAATGGDASYVKGSGGINGGSQFIPPMQGFFVSTTGADVLQFDDAVRTHSGKDNFYKSGNPQSLLLEAAGENFTDETLIHFNEEAGAEHDGQFDAYKRISQSNPGLPQIFSYTPQGVKLGINGMPQAESVPVGFTAVESGEFTISAKEAGEFSEVILEDLLLETQTNLLNNNYVFNHIPGIMEDRFVIHFTTLNVNETASGLYNIFAVSDVIKVIVPEGTTGQIAVYNLMGQQVVETTINGTTNELKIEQTGNYLVKVIGNEGVSTRKVNIQ